MGDRRHYLRQLRAVVRRYRAGEPFDWWAARKACFSALYGLPRDRSVRIGMLSVCRYLPVFRARWPDADEVVRAVHGLELPPAEGDETRPPHTPPPDINLERADSAFLGAVREMGDVVAAGTMPPGRLAASIEGVVWGCILQRALNAWAADDPLAAAVEQANFVLVEESLMMDHPRSPKGRRAEALLLSTEEFLQGRRDDASLPANAVQWREWAVVAEWLTEDVTRYREVDEDGLQAALAVWDGSAEPFETATPPAGE